MIIIRIKRYKRKLVETNIIGKNNMIAFVRTP